MVAEVVIHLGQEWRDLAYCLFGMLCGGFLGAIFMDDWNTRKRRNK